MRKLVLFNHASLDGYVQSEVPWDLGWVAYDSDLEGFAREIVKTADAAMHGRVTFEGMKAYWPTMLDNPDATEFEIQHATWLKNATKIVVSTTMESTDWDGTLIINRDVLESIRKLKASPGKDIVVFGSPTLAHFLIQHDLIDEFRISITPVVLGGGIPLFKDVKDRIRMKLLASRTLPSGVITLHYERVRD
jgi:dihydrofolate reductase